MKENAIVEADEIFIENPINEYEIIKEQVAPRTVGAVFFDIARNPLQLVTRWNWKSAIFSSTMRGGVFFFTYLANKETMKAALGAFTVQFIFRVLFAGVGGSLIQSFRCVIPAWQGTLVVMLLVPGLSHLIEFIVNGIYEQYAETHSGSKSIAASVGFSVLSAIFNIFIMRRGVFIVGEKGEQSLGKDLKQIPVLIAEFVSFLPIEVWKMMVRGKVILGIATIFGSALFVGALFGIVRGKLSWAINTGTGMLILVILGTIIAALVLGKKVK